MPAAKSGTLILKGLRRLRASKARARYRDFGMCRNRTSRVAHALLRPASRLLSAPGPGIDKTVDAAPVSSLEMAIPRPSARFKPRFAKCGYRAFACGTAGSIALSQDAPP